jgi:hypothetical protein
MLYNQDLRSVLTLGEAVVGGCRLAALTRGTSEVGGVASARSIGCLSAMRPCSGPADRDRTPVSSPRLASRSALGGHPGWWAACGNSRHPASVVRQPRGCYSGPFRVRPFEQGGTTIQVIIGKALTSSERGVAPTPHPLLSVSMSLPSASWGHSQCRPGRYGAGCPMSCSKICGNSKSA